MPQPAPIAALILAGGEGRRMGHVDKANLMLAGQTLLQHVGARLQRQSPEIAISANGVPARFAAFSLPVLADQVDLAAMGPLSGILSGLHWAAALGAAGLVSVPVDAPFLLPDLMHQLSRDRSQPAYAVAGGRAHYATAYWPVGLRGALATFLASGVKPKVADFATAQQAQAVYFADAAAFDNLNTPEDLARAEARLAQGDL